MKFRLFLGVVVCAAAFAIPSTGQAQFFADNFDSYANGSNICGQGSWECWDNNPAGDTFVTDQQSFSPPHSLFAALPMDVVRIFSGVDSGIWYAKIKVYLPSTMNGDLDFLLLDRYYHNCNASSDCHWAVQLIMCVNNCGSLGLPGVIQNYGGSDFLVLEGQTAQLVLDDWSEIVVEFDLDASTYDVYYEGVQFVSDSTWTVTGINEIQAFDLFSESNDVGYYDDVWLDQNIPVELMNFDIE